MANWGCAELTLRVDMFLLALEVCGQTEVIYFVQPAARRLSDAVSRTPIKYAAPVQARLCLFLQRGCPRLHAPPSMYLLASSAPSLRIRTNMPESGILPVFISGYL
jgi:hypothetical protein